MIPVYGPPRRDTPRYLSFSIPTATSSSGWSSWALSDKKTNTRRRNCNNEQTQKDEENNIRRQNNKKTSSHRGTLRGGYASQHGSPSPRPTPPRPVSHKGPRHSK